MKRSDTPLPDDIGFTEPWQAEAFSLVVTLQESGRITPSEWAEALGAEIENARTLGDPADGTTYHAHLLCALERLIREKGLLGTEELGRRRHEWEEAYHRTPHGQPVVLKPAGEAERM